MTPGLANKLCIPVATKICCTFPETLQELPADKAILTGSPIRAELTEGSRLRGMELCGFNTSKPVIMVIGGSQGAAGINTLVRDALPALLEDFQIVHICGKEKIDNLLLNTKGYKQFEYVKDDLKDIFAMADLVISRAGANAICELLALKKPNLLIPLPANVSRGDQILNAKSFESQGYSMVADEDFLTGVILTEKIHELYFTRQEYIEAMHNSKIKNSIDTIVKIIEEI
jgi:UDP-N-acetylglucosamine--N-acetylmuramyl-(pentapeptide) pyrophosphoryl-undecaprenol N-acetylglucosamine transferase